MFEMKESENIDEMFSRFTTLTNGIRYFGKIFPTRDRVRIFKKSP